MTTDEIILRLMAIRRLQRLISGDPMPGDELPNIPFERVRIRRGHAVANYGYRYGKHR